jgi:hypothetical protein
MDPSTRRLLLGVTTLAILVFVMGGPAAAHETRKVGPYEFVVGWGDEPTYTGFKNSVQLLLSDAKTGKPVIDLEDTLDVEVIFGDTSTTMTMEPDFVPGAYGEPGDYRAWITPTRAGEFTFNFTGTINGVDIDESFTSGEDTFATPEDVREIQFPVKDPSTAELTERIEREVPRLQQQAIAAADDADAARTLGIVAVALAALALIAGVTGLALGRRGSR